MSMSMSLGPRPASGERTPRSSRTGRRLMYWWKPRRMGMRSPHSETWSGTPGKPTAPRKIASNRRSCSSPSSGIMRPVFVYVSHDQSNRVHCSSNPNRLPATSSTRAAVGTTSLPMPSPGIIAIVWSMTSSSLEGYVIVRHFGRRRLSQRGPTATTGGIPMAATVRGAIRELLEQTMVTIDALLEASDRELAMPSSHGCAQGKDVWTLITNDIDHEKIHTGQVLEARYESRITASPMERLVAEWLAERARFIGSLIGLTDEQFNRETAPGQWTYRVIAKHVLALEQDSLQTLAADQAAPETR